MLHFHMMLEVTDGKYHSKGLREKTAIVLTYLTALEVCR